MLGLLPLLGGRLVFPTGRPPRVGYVPQRDRLDQSWPLSVLDVVLMGRTSLLGPLRRFGPVDRKRACEALERSEEHTSELQSHSDLVCRLLLEKKKKKKKTKKTNKHTRTKQRTKIQT